MVAVEEAASRIGMTKWAATEWFYVRLEQFLAHAHCYVNKVRSKARFGIYDGWASTARSDSHRRALESWPAKEERLATVAASGSEGGAA